MKRRIAATRCAEVEPVGDDGQGVRRQTLESLMRYWATDYDGRKVEARLNARPMFVTQIDGLEIQFVHVVRPAAKARPLIPVDLNVPSSSAARPVGKPNTMAVNLEIPERRRRRSCAPPPTANRHCGCPRAATLWPRSRRVDRLRR